MLDKVQARIKEIEKAIESLLSQHAALSGHLAEAKHMLKLIEETGNVVAPGNPVSEVCHVAEEVIDTINGTE